MVKLKKQQTKYEKLVSKIGVMVVIKIVFIYIKTCFLHIYTCVYNGHMSQMYLTLL